MANWGPDQVQLLLIGGYNLLLGNVVQFTDKEEAVLEQTNGLGDAWEEHSYVGVRKAEFELEAFYDDATGSLHEALGSPPGSASGPRVFSYGVEGTATGADFVGYSGALQPTYERLAMREELTKIKATFKGVGPTEQGQIIRFPNLVTTTGIVATGTPVDNGASNTSGGAGYLQVTALAGAGASAGLTVRIADSPDNITYAFPLTFTDATVAHVAQRVAISGAIQRYAAYDVRSTGAITNWNAFIGLVRT